MIYTTYASTERTECEDCIVQMEKKKKKKNGTDKIKTLRLYRVWNDMTQGKMKREN